MRDRLLGMLLFLPVPLVLWLFTTAPLGIGVSLASGVAIMLTHRLYARPFVLRRVDHRCLWCGGASETTHALAVIDPLGTAPWTTCSANHRDSALRTLATSERWTTRLQIGILGGLGLFLVLAVVAAIGPGHGLVHGDAAALFKLSVALTVIPFGLLAPHGPLPDEAPRSPFPLHIQALVGTVTVLWLFRLVGLVWLFQVVRYAVGRGA